MELTAPWQAYLRWQLHVERPHLSLQDILLEEFSDANIFVVCTPSTVVGAAFSEEQANGLKLASPSAYVLAFTSAQIYAPHVGDPVGLRRFNSFDMTSIERSLYDFIQEVRYGPPFVLSDEDRYQLYSEMKEITDRGERQLALGNYLERLHPQARIFVVMQRHIHAEEASIHAAFFSEHEAKEYMRETRMADLQQAIVLRDEHVQTRHSFYCLDCTVEQLAIGSAYDARTEMYLPPDDKAFVYSSLEFKIIPLE